MLSIFKKLASALIFFAASQAFANFLPPGVVSKASQVGDSNITQAEFNQIVSTISNYWAPFAEAHGAKLYFDAEWNAQEINAYSNEVMGYWLVTITGPLARHPKMTKDGILLVLCHEMGHHLGGFPMMAQSNPLMPVWAAAEGQADYFASQVCAHNMWESEPDVNAQFRDQVSPIAKEKCDAVWKTQTQQDLCYRTSVGVQAIMGTMADAMKKPMPQYDTPDTSVVTTTINQGYPGIQCRMDTSFAAMQCTAAFDFKTIPNAQEAVLTSCMLASGYSVGNRPECWFKE